MTDSEILPLGKLPPQLLHRLISAPQGSAANDPRVVLGPGVGLDCAVVDAGNSLFVFKSEPITFATDEIGWYGVQIAANDIATTGAQPRWYLATLLLPERRTTPQLVERIFTQAQTACQQIGVSIIGGHTEVTYGIDRPLLMGTLIGEVSRAQLITPRGAQPGDVLLLTKGVPVEATAILAREFAERMRGVFTPDEIEQARSFLYRPGVSILDDARIATRTGSVHAMHDPTEGGLYAALWELATASDVRLIVDQQAVPVPELSARVCAFFGLDPLATIASGALLLAAAPETAPAIHTAMQQAGILCAEIGRVGQGTAQVTTPGGDALPWPERDDLTRVFE